MGGWGERPGSFAPNSGQPVIAQLGAVDWPLSTGAQEPREERPSPAARTNPVLECE